ncbi:hypothetical protein R1flu_014826 [Riccia fluitans]|uniref:Uncharacterized protein n=1 Tax=Riccia fluitans TaxID=41844 RepID=A0ABD1YHJ5_9MARC
MGRAVDARKGGAAMQGKFREGTVTRGAYTTGDTTVEDEDVEADLHGTTKERGNDEEIMSERIGDAHSDAWTCRTGVEESTNGINGSLPKQE